MNWDNSTYEQIWDSGWIIIETDISKMQVEVNPLQICILTSLSRSILLLLNLPRSIVNDGCRLPSRHRAVKLIPRTLNLGSCAKWVSITTKEDLILEKFRAEALPLPNQPRWRPAHWASKCIMGESGGVVRKWALAGVRTGNIFARLTSFLP